MSDSHPLSRQQRESFDYFDGTAEDWQRKARGINGQVNVIAERNATVLRFSEQLRNSPHYLDIGCGSGELVLAMAERSRTAHGLDFAPEMIKLCEEGRARVGLSNMQFECESILGDWHPNVTVDLASALGLIEYFSFDELRRMLAKVHDFTAPGGHLIIGSRNRLFNVVSLSAYTEMELRLGTIGRLLSESIALASGPPESAVVRLADYHNRLPQPEQHPNTGIQVATRHQYTPGELEGILRDHSFEAVALYPVHYHALPVPAANARPDLHAAIAEGINSIAHDDPRLVPYASSFVLAARKV